MNHLLKITLLFLVPAITIFSCGTKNNRNLRPNVNTRLNKEYKESKKAFSGKLNNFEYKALKNVFKNELNTEIPEGKSILINYYQKAPNCLRLNLNNNDISRIIENEVQISSRISLDNSTIDFFVFSENAPHKELYSTRLEFKLDSGFFYDKVFTLHENCEAFFLIKPNGDFLIYYGEDYFSKVEEFQKKE